MDYEWNFSVVWDYQAVLLNGLLHTVALAIVTIIASMILGLFLTLLRMSRMPFVHPAISMIISIVRAVPVLVLLVWMYYCLPIVTGWRPNGYTTVVIALSIYSSAFFAEIFRSGIRSIDRGHIEAAQSVGMTRGQTFRRIVAPLALQRIFPPLVSQCILVLKNTTLAGYVAVPELLYVGQQISVRTFRPLELLTVVAVLYVITIVPLTLIAEYFEKKFHESYFR
ncbi:amino acid ABC transporter permease [Methylobacterium oryzae]|uniref:amino acid ABC transporter permease n=1 Tax=Methylobacterium oryzae TaxID=334852 RepID=UPI001F409718|nr:amino acid ABC transporter permease [Methylobacterium oryzae]UIN35039.1 amino acid ABC transporter permease [Methylobacterium oryzae]